jgi:hypothetical protein
MNDKCTNTLLTPLLPLWGTASNSNIEILQKYQNVLRAIVNSPLYTGYTQNNDAVSKVNKKFISHLTRAQPTPSSATTVQVSRALITILQCVHPGSHDTHPHGNQIHPRLGVACPL